MSAVFLTEVTLSPKYALQQIAISLIVALATMIGMNNIYAIAPIVIISLVFSHAFTLAALDEQNGWDRYRAALPLTRSQIMMGRMCALGVRLFVIAMFGIALEAIMSALAPWIATFAPIQLEGYEFDLPYILLAAGLGILASVILIALTVPLIAKFGMTSAIRYVPLAFAAFAIFCIIMANIAPTEYLTSNFEYLLATYVWPINLALIAISIAIYALGTYAAIAFYKKRQF